MAIPYAVEMKSPRLGKKELVKACVFKNLVFGQQIALEGCENAKFSIKRCAFCGIEASTDGGAIHLVSKGDFFSKNCLFVKCTTSSANAGSVFADVKRYEMDRNCFVRSHSSQQYMTFFLGTNDASCQNRSVIYQCAPFPIGIYCVGISYGPSFLMKEYNASDSQIGDRQILICHSMQGMSTHFHGTDFNNTATCLISAQSNNYNLGGTSFEECNYIGNRRTSSSFTHFIHSHQATLQFVGSVAIGNNHQVLAGSYGTVKIDISGCHFCSNGFASPANGRPCIPTYILNVPILGQCAKSSRFTVDSEGRVMFTCLLVHLACA